MSPDVRNRAEHGWILVGSLILVTTLAGIALAMGVYIYYGIRAEQRYEAQERARYVAEAGLATYIFQYWIQNPDSVPIAELTDGFDQGEYTVYRIAGDTFRVVATYNGQRFEIRAALQTKGSDWPYVLMADERIEFGKKASGQIIGDVHANGRMRRRGNVTVQGKITYGRPDIKLPEIDWNYFKQKAIDTGQFINGNHTFDRQGSPYSGVWYVTREARIKEDVVFTGTLVAERRIRIVGDEVILQSTGTAHPLLLSKSKIEVKGKQVQLKGFVYARRELVFKGDDGTLDGAACAKREIELEAGNLKIRYKAGAVQNLKGVRFNGSQKGARIQIVEWNEN